MTYPFKTKMFVAKDWGQARAAAADLVLGSCWFEVTPIPYDRYEFGVKDEACPTSILRQLGLEEA